jgi:chromosome segregation ATPase
MNVIQNVYDALKRGTEKLSEKKEAVKGLQAQIDSKRYSDTANKEKLLQMQNIQREISEEAAEIEAEANRLVDAYCDELRAADELKPSELTDDVKLLNCGVRLNEHDIEAMIKRNDGNATMLQLIERYAKENGIAPRGLNYRGNVDVIRQVEGVKYTIHTYVDHWIDKDNALDMLNRFFEGYAE